MTVARTIAAIRARRITASSITQSELVDLVDAAETGHDESLVSDLRRGLVEAAERELAAAYLADDARRSLRLRAALRLSVLEAERDAARTDAGIAAFFDAKAAWSLATFGPGERLGGVLAHIRKELDEIAAKPSDLEEWIDVAMIAMDGSWRSAGADGAAWWAALRAKHEKNLRRSWPAIGTTPPDRPIEHAREHDALDARLGAIVESLRPKVCSPARVAELEALAHEQAAKVRAAERAAYEERRPRCDACGRRGYHVCTAEAR